MSSHRESYCFTLLSNLWAFIFIFYLHAHICTYSAGSCTVMFNCSSHLLSYELVWFHLKMNFLFTVQSPLSRLADIQTFKVPVILHAASPGSYFRLHVLYITTRHLASLDPNPPVFLPIHDKRSHFLPFQNKSQTSGRLIHISSIKF